MRVFCIGFNKTGTTSLHKALEMLGFKPTHDHKISQEICEYAADGKIHPATEKYDAFLDFPSPELFKDLDHMYPGSKFILTVRDVEDWITSRLSHVLMNRRIPERQSSWTAIDTENDRKRWEGHVKNVRGYFKNRQDDFLEFNICDGQKWRPLIAFLGKERPNTDFPCEGAMADRSHHWGQIKSKPEFTTDWVSQRGNSWRNLLADLMGKPNLNMLEIGSYEGRSTLWWLNNLLTDSSSRITCIDNWDKRAEFEKRFDRNVAASGHSCKVRKIKQPSWSGLKILHPTEMFDVVYVDGSHEAKDVMLDGLTCLEHLKPGGFMIFDDYAWNGRRHFMPKIALDLFTKICNPWCEVVEKGYQLAVRKRQKPIPIPDRGARSDP